LAAEDRNLGDTDNAILYENAIARLSALDGNAVESITRHIRRRAIFSTKARGRQSLCRDQGFHGAPRRRHGPHRAPYHRRSRSLTAVTCSRAIPARFGAAAADAQWSRVDILLLPTAPTQDRVDDVNADP